MSPFLITRVIQWLIGIISKKRKNLSEDEFLECIRKSTENDTPYPPASTSSYTVTSETFNGSIDTWSVLHFTPTNPDKSNNKVILEFQGGAFSFRSPAIGNKLQGTRASTLGCPIIYPHYTLIPLPTGTRCIATALELLEAISKDRRYVGKEIVLSGQSAGGWVALRLLLALGEIATGKRTARDPIAPENVSGAEVDLDLAHLAKWLSRNRALELAKMISSVILLSPWVDTSLDHPDDLKFKDEDVVLSRTLLQSAARIWGYGPNVAYPNYNFEVGSKASTLSLAVVPMTDPRHSPIYGLDILPEVFALTGRQVHICQFVGTIDLFYPQNLRMAGILDQLGVPHSIHEFPGVGHIIIWPMPEASVVMKENKKLLQA